MEVDGATQTRVVTDLTELVRGGERFATVYCDPPWAFDNQATRAAAVNHYPVLSVAEIAALPVANLAAGDCQLHLWVPTSFLEAALTKVVRGWGFQFKSMFVWCKSQIGLGSYWRSSHELLLTATKGSATFRDRSLSSWHEFPRTKHSRKPTAVREMVERAGHGPRLEMFARETAVGWTSFGNEVRPQHQRPLLPAGDTDSLARVLGHVGPLTSHASKAEAVRQAVSDVEASKLSDRQIAEHLGCSHPFVAKIRRQLAEATGNGYQSARRIGRDGRTIDTARIGRKPLHHQAQRQDSPGKTSVST